MPNPWPSKPRWYRSYLDVSHSKPSTNWRSNKTTLGWLPRLQRALMRLSYPGDIETYPSRQAIAFLAAFLANDATHSSALRQTLSITPCRKSESCKSAFGSAKHLMQCETASLNAQERLPFSYALHCLSVCIAMALFGLASRPKSSFFDDLLYAGQIEFQRRVARARSMVPSSSLVYMLEV